MAKGRKTSSGESRSWGGPGSSSSPANIPPVGTVPNSSFAAPGSGSGGSDSSCSSALAPTAGAFQAGAGPPKGRGSPAAGADHSGITGIAALSSWGSGMGSAALHSDCAGAGGAAPQASIAGSAESTAAAQSGPARSELQSAPRAVGAPASGVEARSKSATGASGCHSCAGSVAGTVDQVSSGAGMEGASSGAGMEGASSGGGWKGRSGRPCIRARCGLGRRHRRLPSVHLCRDGWRDLGGRGGVGRRDRRGRLPHRVDRSVRDLDRFAPGGRPVVTGRGRPVRILRQRRRRIGSWRQRRSGGERRGRDLLRLGRRRRVRWCSWSGRR